MTPEDRGRSPTMQERMCRWPRVNNLEQTRMIRAWGLLEKERKTVTESRDALLIGWKRSECHVQNDAERGGSHDRSEVLILCRMPLGAVQA